jgi:hypothetical protein
VKSKIVVGALDGIATEQRAFRDQADAHEDGRLLLITGD